MNNYEAERDCIIGDDPVVTTYLVKINKASNGFIVNVGCKTFVFAQWVEATTALKLYWEDPVAAEKRYCK